MIKTLLNFYKIQEEIKEERDGFINQTVKEHELADFNGDFDMKVAVKILRNKFNYSERQSQTTNPLIKEKGVSTAKPVLKNFSAEVNLSWIYDIFVKEHHLI